MIKQILKFTMIILGSFLLMYNILNIDSDIIDMGSRVIPPEFFVVKYYYHPWNILGASIGFSILMTGIFINDKKAR